jgi:hypothetical protein
LEITRVATDGTVNATSCLYAACWRKARRLGHAGRLVTYTTPSVGETGAALRGAGWHVTAETSCTRLWDTPSRRRTGGWPQVTRLRWEPDYTTAKPLYRPQPGLFDWPLAA